MDVIEYTSDGKTRLKIECVDWYSVLPALDIPLDLINNPRKLGPCPKCGGNTRFRFVNDDGRGHWYCNGCGSGDAPKLLQVVFGWNKVETIFKIKEVVMKGVVSGDPPIRQEPIANKPDRKAARKWLERTRSESSLMTEDCAAWRYLFHRIPGLRLEWISPYIRAHSRLYHKLDEVRDRKTNEVLQRKKVSFWPGMLGIVVDKKKQPVTIHRTYLTAQGLKAFSDPDEVKKQMTGTRKLAGDHIPVNIPRSTSPRKLRILIVCEGIETALAIVAMTGNEYPVWAMLNAANLSVLDFECEDYDLVIVAGDHDFEDKFGKRAGHVYGKKAVERCQQLGKRAVLRLPEVEGEDWCDVWNRTCQLATNDQDALVAA
jgi:putative DNA primase/helicase